MLVLIQSECQKRAWPQTQRIVDAFAQRVGRRSWITEITEVGLRTLYQNLRRVAQRNTAVACHVMRPRGLHQLLWTVGRRGVFDVEGVVAVGSKSLKALRPWVSEQEEEVPVSAWVAQLSQLAALFHDWGKANDFFAAKLKAAKPVKDPFRHEWLSLHLFAHFVNFAQERQLDFATALQHCADKSWAKDCEQYIKGRWQQDPYAFAEASDFLSASLGWSPLYRSLAWLIVTHHHLPRVSAKDVSIDFAAENDYLAADFLWSLHPKQGYGAYATCDEKEGRKNLRLKPLPLGSKLWQQAAVVAGQQLAQLQAARPLAQVPLLVLHQARLHLMVGDHFYSSLRACAPVAAGEWLPPKHRILRSKSKVYANSVRGGLTAGPEPAPNQPLDMHLWGVAQQAKRAAWLSPSAVAGLPRLTHAQAFEHASVDPRFAWQDQAARLVAAEQRQLQRPECGFFAVVMASTGTGKTLANCKIAHALYPAGEGSRMTLLLGLRALTLQTGAALKQRLRQEPTGMLADEVAVVIGSAAAQQLFELRQGAGRSAMTEEAASAAQGSESLDELWEQAFVHWPEGKAKRESLHPFLQMACKDVQQRHFLQAPILVATLDQLIGASERTRGGRHILPMLRLQSGVVVIDEVDGFGLEDLPALVRFVFTLGMLGGKVILSSATLPPALATGLYRAYTHGLQRYREVYARGADPAPVVCLWADEYRCQQQPHQEVESFATAHQQFCQQRVQDLQQQPVQRRGSWMALATAQEGEAQPPLRRVATALWRSIAELAAAHCTPLPETSTFPAQRLSVGLVRCANINPLVALCREMAAPAGGPQAYAEFRDRDTVYFYVCYHSQFPLYVRDHIERQLDQLADRSVPTEAFATCEMVQHLRERAGGKHMVVTVFASPVIEVGRDHDYDWMVIEPSSSMSLIQTSGRCRRHRPVSAAASLVPNIHVWDHNFKMLQPGEQQRCFSRPGYENRDLRLAGYDLRALLPAAQLEKIDARPRVVAPADEAASASAAPQTLAELEHRQIAAAFARPEVTNWCERNLSMLGQWQVEQPFRAGTPTRLYHLTVSETGPSGELSFYAWKDRSKRDKWECDRLFVAVAQEDTVMQCLWEEDYSQLWEQLQATLAGEKQGDEALQNPPVVLDAQEQQRLYSTYGEFGLPAFQNMREDAQGQQWHYHLRWGFFQPQAWLEQEEG